MTDNAKSTTWSEALTSQNGATTSSKGRLSAPARISLLYESRDKRLCIFEDAQGHLTAVRASRLA